MSAWPGKFAIGLTGNIATGKSVVRKMLEHLGAYGIDADALAHRTFAPGAPGYQPVVDRFGPGVLAPGGEIDRPRLARIVFSDPEALKRLEAIVHPLVGQAVDALIQRSRHTFVVIEAIKLLESDLRPRCDSIWVTYAPADVQLQRLMQKRGLTEAAARQRIQAQPSQEAKIAAAQVVIRNDGSFEEIWRQVTAAWQALFPAIETARPVEAPARRGQLVVQRARPQQAAQIAAFMNRLNDHPSGGQSSLSGDHILAAFGEKAFLLLQRDGELVGLAGWEVENLVARTSEVYVAPVIPFGEALHSLLVEVEQSSQELQCEASLLFLPCDLAGQEAAWKALGYEARTIESLGVSAWQEAARESMPPGTVLLFKRLATDRVLQPV